MNALSLASWKFLHGYKPTSESLNWILIIILDTLANDKCYQNIFNYQDAQQCYLIKFGLCQDLHWSLIITSCSWLPCWTFPLILSLAIGLQQSMVYFRNCNRTLEMSYQDYKIISGKKQLRLTNCPCNSFKTAIDFIVLLLLCGNNYTTLF